ncbi:hypothetical protein NVV95_02820 [Herbiconiux sp. CPCC 205716]|uniref:DUF6199 domain-containing protein n=1 Tax=Herbiconiux gentiana TaxID=2970912 RepID=A0ABT2GB97_9MICO|nr:hypothetical protein [Herbiconiux gentiana]MCS5713482.1 hypothetical protein [Herbiconiux gentiana]
MLYLLAAVIALAGLWCLLAPPRAMLFGTRWQLADGENAMPSRAWIAYTRGSGVVLLVVAVVLVIVTLVTQGQNRDRASLKEAWEIGRYLSSDELQIDLDPEVREVSSVQSTIGGYSGETQGLRVHRSAVVGVDAVGDVGDVKDGDLLVAVIAGGCRPGPVLVSETDSTVTVAVTGIGFEVLDEPIVCGGERPRLTDPDAEELLIVRVPLTAPLGDRDLVLPDPPKRDRPARPIPGLPSLPTTAPTASAAPAQAS